MPPPPSAPPPPPSEGPWKEPVGVWFNFEYLLWWIKDSPVSPLVTYPVTPADQAFGPASSQVLYGGGTVGNDARSGGRFTGGFWVDDSQTLGFEGSYYFLGPQGVRLAEGAVNGSPPGDFQANLTSHLQSAEVNLLTNTARLGVVRLDLLGGFRYLQLKEALTVNQDFAAADMSEDDSWDDEFRTRNDFYGGQIGARAEFTWERLFLNVSGKVALGVTHQNIAIGGGLTQALSTFSTDRFGDTIQNTTIYQDSLGGLLAPPAQFSRNQFTVIPEVGFNVGCQVTDYLRVFLGYSFLYWSSVARPGQQVLSPPQTTTFWAQGLNCGLALNF
jgi:hypothetical protein